MMVVKIAEAFAGPTFQASKYAAAGLLSILSIPQKE
jgi:hypothetical protein